MLIRVLPPTLCCHRPRATACTRNVRELGRCWVLPSCWLGHGKGVPGSCKVSFPVERLTSRRARSSAPFHCSLSWVGGALVGVLARGAPGRTRGWLVLGEALGIVFSRLDAVGSPSEGEQQEETWWCRSPGQNHESILYFFQIFPRTVFILCTGYLARWQWTLVVYLLLPTCWIATSSISVIPPFSMCACMICACMIVSHPRSSDGFHAPGRPTRTSWSPTRRPPPPGARPAASGPSGTRSTTRGSTPAPSCALPSLGSCCIKVRVTRSVFVDLSRPEFLLCPLGSAFGCRPSQSAYTSCVWMASRTSGRFLVNGVFSCFRLKQVPPHALPTENSCRDRWPRGAAILAVSCSVQAFVGVVVVRALRRWDPSWERPGGRSSSANGGRWEMRWDEIASPTNQDKLV